MVYDSPRGKQIMRNCTCHRHWSDHGGSFPSEEVAGWLFGELPTMFENLRVIDFNTFASRHGKDRADSVGSLIVQFLREKQLTNTGLQPNLPDIIAYLNKRIKQNQRAHNGDLEIIIIAWEPKQLRPEEAFILDVKNMRKSYSKRYMRNVRGQSVIIEKGLPTTSDNEDTGVVIKLKPKFKERRAKPKKQYKPKKKVNLAPPRLSEWAIFRQGKAQQQCNVPVFLESCVS